MGERKLTVLCAAKLHENQLERHLELLERSERVGRILVVRHKPLPERLSKLENLSFGSGSLPRRAYRMAETVRDAVVGERVDWVLGFNPVPWGSLALLGAAGTQARVALSMIGRDALQVQKLWAAPFREALRRADAVTVTGEKMGREVERFGVRPERLHVLPHSVDLRRFRPTAASDPAPVFDVISVGQLIRRKRMDILISAVALARDQGAPVRLAILGRGPDKEALERLARKLGVESLVTFLDYRDDVEVALRGARAFALVSEWEGVPFALMEAMATGLVPIVTDVGTISDWVRPGQNGVIVPVRNAPAVARAFIRLFHENLEERAEMERCLLAERERLSIESGVRVWEKIFEDAETQGRLESART